MITGEGGSVVCGIKKSRSKRYPKDNHRRTCDQGYVVLKKASSKL